MGESSVRWGVEWVKCGNRILWSIGCNLARWADELYLCFNIGPYRLTIGKFQQPDGEVRYGG